MSDLTNNLELFKYNTAEDGKQVFDIDAALNANWDKIDAFKHEVDTVFSSSLSSQLDKNLFNEINEELGKKLEAEVLLEENGYIKFNNTGLILV